MKTSTKKSLGPSPRFTKAKARAFAPILKHKPVSSPLLHSYKHVKPKPPHPEGASRRPAGCPEEHHAELFPSSHFFVSLCPALD
mmetsp:Transcript_10626/g.20610  ORF Transcript_10626/g.20610 Transcript_10626/m.20610 type:complete len:84 (+) Transcript_10626:227-478(+)